MSRNTEQKERILRTFKKGYTPTADELLNKLRQSDPSFSRATMYRNLSAFVDSGDLKKISIVGHNDRYELNTGCNYHLVCEICGKLTDLDMEGAIQTPEQIMDYNITYHELMFYGICPKCQKKLNKLAEEFEDYNDEDEYDDEDEEYEDSDEYDEDDSDEVDEDVDDEEYEDSEADEEDYEDSDEEDETDEEYEDADDDSDEDTDEDENEDDE